MNSRSKFVDSLIVIIILFGPICAILYYYMQYDSNIKKILSNACNTSNGEEYIFTNKDGSQIQCANKVCNYIDKNGKQTEISCNYEPEVNNKTPEIIVNNDNKETPINNETKNTTNNNQSNQNINNNTNENNENKTNNNNSTSTNTTPSTSNNNQNTTPPIQQNLTVQERIQLAYSKASTKGNGSVSLNNFKNELKTIFGNEGKGYNIYDNGLAWLIEVPNESALEIINRSGNFEDYLIPERDCGAAGNGITDDTQAMQTCLKSNVKNLVLTGTYLLTGTVNTAKEKSIFKGTIKCEALYGAIFQFSGIVRFSSTQFNSSRQTTAKSAHGETYQRTSKLDFVEVWGKEAYFYNCRFENALRAIRGRISTGATIVPDKLYVNGTEFVECKAPIQGFFARANVENSTFINDGDVYHGDHVIYLESFGSKELNVKNCTVKTLNSASGAAFQIYNKKSGQSNTPKITVTNCTILANGIVSSDLAAVTISNTTFSAQSRLRYVINLDEGCASIDKCNFTHDYFFPPYPNVPITASNSTFKLLKFSDSSRAYFPIESTNCRFINWGGSVAYPNTHISNSVFTRDGEHSVGNYYLSVGSGGVLTIENSAFKAGDSLAYKSPGTIHLINCHYVNNIGQELGTVIEEGTIHDDIVN